MKKYRLPRKKKKALKKKAMKLSSRPSLKGIVESLKPLGSFVIAASLSPELAKFLLYQKRLEELKREQEFERLRREMSIFHNRLLQSNPITDKIHPFPFVEPA